MSLFRSWFLNKRTQFKSWFLVCFFREVLGYENRYNEFRVVRPDSRYLIEQVMIH